MASRRIKISTAHRRDGRKSNIRQKRNVTVTQINSDFAFDFIDSSSLNTDGSQWESYQSAAASSFGDDLSMYDCASSEGEHSYSEIYAADDRNNIDIDSDTDNLKNGTGNYSGIILPIPWIPARSPPSSPARPPSVNSDSDNEIYNLKRPRSPVAADLDTANILPVEHRRKRVKPARVRQ